MEPEEYERPIITNRQIAEVLSSIASLLEFQSSNPYRIQAYRNAARGILDLSEQAAAIVDRGEPLPVPGLGQRLQGRIAELVRTGVMTFYNDVCFQTLPTGVRNLMQIEHIGPRTAIRLYEELGIDTTEKLWRATQQERIRLLPGFGPRSEARLRESVIQMRNRRQTASRQHNTLGGVA